MADLSDEVLRALAHRERRRLLGMCRDRAMAAGDLAAGAGMAHASVSEHLKVLRKTGLAVVEKQGKFWMYRADVGRLAEVIAELEAEMLGEGR
ncbi:MAG: metalloregulator ArsR/SmtB family transcription factor [Pseudomonadota bacterium]